MSEQLDRSQDRRIDLSTPVQPTSILLDVDNVGLRYPTASRAPVDALSNISLAIASGEFVSILGPSGCGKSSLLMLMAGLLEPTTGAIRFDGKLLNGPPAGVGVVFQDPILLPWRTVLENVLLPGEVAGAVDRDKAKSLLSLVGLTGFEECYPHELSGGMQQRVAIARALLLSPALLLMDEPFGALDAMTREHMNLEIQRIVLSTGATVVFVTHSITESAFLSDRVVVMTGRPGRVSGIVTIAQSRPRSLEALTEMPDGFQLLELRQLLNAGIDLS